LRYWAFIWFLGLSLALLLRIEVAEAQEPTPTSTPRPLVTPRPATDPYWGECGPVPDWWGLATPSPRWFAICGHCRQVWPTPELRFFPTPTPHPWLATQTPFWFPTPTPPTGTPEPTPTPTPTPLPDPVAVITITDSSGYPGSLPYFGLPAGGVSFPVYEGWEMGGTFEIFDGGGESLKVMIDVYSSQPLTFTVGMGYYEFTDRYCSGLWGSSFLIGTEDFGGPGQQPYAGRDLVICWDEDLYQPSVQQHYLTNLDSAFALAVSVTRARVWGWWWIRVEGGVSSGYPPTPTPMAAVTPTPELTPEPTPDPGGIDCSNPDPGEDVEIIPVPRVGDRFCAGIGPVNVTIPLVGEISIPEFRICFVPIWFGSVDLFGIRVNLDAVFFIMGAALLVRWFLRS